MRRGWFGESYRHYLAGKGVVTKRYLSRRIIADKVFPESPNVGPQTVAPTFEQRLNDVDENVRKTLSKLSTVYVDAERDLRANAPRTGSPLSKWDDERRYVEANLQSEVERREKLMNHNLDRLRRLRDTILSRQRVLEQRKSLTPEEVRKEREDEEELRNIAKEKYALLMVSEIDSEYERARAEAMGEKVPKSMVPHPERKYLSTVKEDDANRERRVNRGYLDVVEVDAKKLQERFEKDRGEPLAWSKDRLANLKDVSVLDDYPQVDVGTGRVDVNDGRHRIAAAALRGETIPVAVRDRKRFEEVFR